jgi:hypothetical protein
MNVPKHNKEFIWQTYSKNYSKCGNTATISIKVVSKPMALYTLIKYSVEFIAIAIRQEKETKDIK